MKHCLHFGRFSGGIPSRRAAGFALVVTLTMLILLVVVAVGLLTLSGVSVRATSGDLLMQQARQNARMAMLLALGELQQSCGPDQRVTAAAEIRGDAVIQPHLTGVWKGWKWDGQGDPPDFGDRKHEDFLGWLVSTAAEERALDPAFPESAPSGRLATLVGGGADGRSLVEAGIIPVSGADDGRRGGFAWAVFDEATKLPTALLGRRADTPLLAMHGMTAASLPGYAGAADGSWSPLADLGAERIKLLTPGESALAGIRAENRGFHDLTSGSAGLLSDVAAGGFAIDLSRLFDHASLPPEYATRFLYSDVNTPLANAPPRFAGANPLPDPDPSWKLLHSHYRMYEHLGGGMNPLARVTSTARPPAGSPARTLRHHPFFHSQQLAPVIAKAQFVFSLSFAFNAQSLRLSSRPDNESLPPGRKDEWITWLVTDPVITLWNPYNVTLQVPSARIDLYRVPMSFRIYKNGTLINREYTHFANTFWDYHFDSRASYYRLNLLPEQGRSEIVLAPGEHLVFTAVNSTGHAGNSYFNPGVTLRPGFSPPAGPRTRPGAGGVTTLNVCVGADSRDSGTDYGKMVRTVAVKAGDRIELDVAPQVLNLARSPETGGRDIAGFLKYHVGDPNNPTLVGGIEIDYGDDLAKHLPPFGRRDLPAIVVRDDIPRQGAQQGEPSPVIAFKEPFLITTFQLKTERDSKHPSRGWIHNSPTNLYAAAGSDRTEAWTAQQYELQWEPMHDWPPSSPTIEISNTGNRGYGGSGIYAQSGVEFATFATVPLAPALSLPQLRHAPLNHGGQLPLSAQVIAGSFASPLIPADQIQRASRSGVMLDHSYLANNALFDRTFFSGLATPGGPLASQQPSVAAAVRGLFEEHLPLANARFFAHAGGQTSEEITSAITAPDGHLRSASHLLIDGPFNINSTRVDVWQAVLASTLGVDVPLRTNRGLSTTQGTDMAASRHLPAAGVAYETAEGPLEEDLAKWNGHRRLDETQTRRLAEEIVAQVRLRGPFQSLAEFVNRRPEKGPLGRAGALQTAIELSGINDGLLDPLHRTGGLGQANPEAAEGNTADGAPGILSQADLLTPIAPILTARGDTFRIRAYGEAGPENGPKAKAWCEAVVQRLPPYLVADADKASDAPSHPLNVRFGRRYHVVSFRWLSSEEI